LSQAAKNNDSIKIAGLVIGLGLVVGFIAWQFMSAGSVPAPPPSIVDGSTTDSKPAESLTLTDPAAKVTADASIIEIPSRAGFALSDPFRTVLREAPVASTISRPVTNHVPMMPPSLITGASDTIPTMPLPITGSEAVPLSSLGLSVDGVIIGDNSVAVVRMGSETYVARVGEVFADGLAVVSISDRKVVIAKGDQRIGLAVGAAAS
jgi:hypothetical protein